MNGSGFSEATTIAGNITNRATSKQNNIEAPLFCLIGADFNRDSQSEHHSHSAIFDYDTNFFLQSEKENPSDHTEWMSCPPQSELSLGCATAIQGDYGEKIVDYSPTK